VQLAEELVGKQKNPGSAGDPEVDDLMNVKDD
jgi:hypothetical protein